jgi:outer membrane protein
MYAQKFGYINSAALLLSIPEVKAADNELETFGKQLHEKGQGMVKDLQDKYAEVSKKDQAGELSPKQTEEATKQLKEMEASIQEFEQQIAQQTAQKREQLYRPILDKVNTAIKDVAKDNGYQYIFDASPGSGILLYAEESTDVMALVKKKLNLQ